MSVSAGSVPLRERLTPVGNSEVVCLAIEPDPTVSTKGSEIRIVRCVLHGVAYDSERETCPECAKGSPPALTEEAGLDAPRESF